MQGDPKPKVREVFIVASWRPYIFYIEVKLGKWHEPSVPFHFHASKDILWNFSAHIYFKFLNKMNSLHLLFQTV
jgi:hypothetical protein